METVGIIETPKGSHELCAAADATYEESTHKLVIALDAFLRPVDFRIKEEHYRAPWMPKSETISEGVDSEDSGALARDIFHRWVAKVRESAPSLHRA